MKTKLDFKSKGYFSLAVTKADGTPVPAKSIKNNTNVVTYTGAVRALLTSPISESYYAGVGTGTTEIVRSDTNLGNVSSGLSAAGTPNFTVGDIVDNGNGTCTATLTRVMQFPVGAKVGTFSEVGMFWTTNPSGSLVAGQLIKDEFGSPTTITVLADEQLTVTYTLEFTLPNAPYLAGTGVLTDASGNTYSYELWNQPYFEDASTVSRYGRSGRVNIRGVDGTSILGVTSSLPNMYFRSSDLVHDGAGNVTWPSQVMSASPSAFSATGIGFILPQGGSTNTNGNWNISNTEQPYVKYGTPVILKLLNPITKTSSDTLEVQIELEITV